MSLENTTPNYELEALREKLLQQLGPISGIRPEAFPTRQITSKSPLVLQRIRAGIITSGATSSHFASDRSVEPGWIVNLKALDRVGEDQDIALHHADMTQDFFDVFLRCIFQREQVARWFVAYGQENNGRLIWAPVMQIKKRSPYLFFPSNWDAGWTSVNDPVVDVSF